MREGNIGLDGSILNKNDFPIYLNSYYAIDFKAVELGYKKVHKIFEAKEIQRYYPIHLREIDDIKNEKIAKEAHRKRMLSCLYCLYWCKSLKEESYQERK